MKIDPVNISDRAAEEIKLIMQSDEIPDESCVRIGVSEGGCGSGGFTIGFDTRKSDDIQISKQGLQILIDKKHVMYLMGKEITYKEDGETWGFVFVDQEDFNKSKKYQK